MNNHNRRHLSLMVKKNVHYRLVLHRLRQKTMVIFNITVLSCLMCNMFYMYVLDSSDYNEQVEDLLNISEIISSQPLIQMSICTPKKNKSKFNNVNLIIIDNYA